MKSCIIFFVFLILPFATTYAQTMTGAAQVCPGIPYGYTISDCQGTFNTYNRWRIDGSAGVFTDTNTNSSTGVGASFAEVIWSSSGAIHVDMSTKTTPPYAYECGDDKGVTVVKFTSSADPTTLPGDYCKDEPVKLMSQGGFGNYNWEYQIEGSGFVHFGSNTNNITFSLNEVFGSNYFSYLNKKFFFRCTVDYGTPNIVNQFNPANGLIGPYQFYAEALSPTFDQIPPNCLGGSDGQIIVLGYGRPAIAGETFSYEVRSSPTIPDVAGGQPDNLETKNALSAGTHYALAYSNYGNCGGIHFKEIIVANGPRKTLSAIAMATPPICSDGNGTITITAINSYGTISHPVQYSIDNGSFQTSNVFSRQSGTYTNLKVTDGCDTGTPAVFTIPNSTTIGSVSKVMATPVPSWCNISTSDGSVTLSGSGGNNQAGTWEYSFNSGAFNSVTTYSNLQTGVPHSVIAKDPSGCISDIKYVTIPNPLTASYNITNPICGTDKGVVTISGVTGGTGPYTYSLNGATAVEGTMSNGHTFTGLPSGINSVILYDVQGCSTPLNNLLVSIPPTINVSATATKVSCLGGSNGTITATALNTVGAVQYSLDGGTTYQASNQFVNKTIGSAYRVTVKDANSCVMQSGFILVDQIPTLTGTVLQTTNILCHGDTGIKGAALDLTPAGGTPDGDYLYLWSNNATSQDVTGLSAGTYSVTIKDKNLCATTLPNIVVSEPALLSSSLVKTDVSCNPSHGTALSSNGAINLIPAGGTGAYHYNWSTNAVTEDISNLAAGTYDVTITDDNGCTTTNAATLTQPLAVTSLVDTFSDITCKGLNNGSVTLLATGGTSVFSYSLNGTAWQGSPVFSGLMPNNYTFYTRDQKGCATQLNKAIAEPDLLVATVVNIEGTTCGNSNGSAQVNVTGGNGSYQYAWKNAFNQIVGTSNVLSDASGDAYTIVVVDSKNCSDTKSALISNSDGAQIQIDAVDPTTCYDTHDGKAAITVSAGAAPYSITWDNDETGLTPIALLPGDNIVRVSDANNCVAVKLVAIPFPDAIAIDTKVITPPTCPGSTDAGVALTMKGGNGSYTYAWSNGSTASLINNVAAGDYGVTVKDRKNCTYTSSIKIDAIPELKLSVVNEKLPTCFDGADGALTVGTSGGNGTYSYQWTAGPAAPQIENINAGPYTVKVTDVKGCNLTSTFTLNNPVKFTISIEDKTICVGQKFKIASDIANGSYSWTSTKGFSSTQQEVTLTDPDVYTLKVINAQGCEAQDSFNLITSTELLHADLIMISEAYTADTVVVIDLSWPLPDVTTWLFPTQATVVEENNQLGYAFLQFPQQGQYDVAIRASLGDCVDTYSQAIKIKEGGVTNSGGRQSSINVIQYFEVYPNPNKGEFTVVTDLYEVQSVRLTLVNVEGNKVLLNQYAEGKSSYNWQVSLPDLTQGTYFLVLKAGKETKAVRMMKL